MTKTIDTINVAADTFQVLVARVNTIIDTLASEIVTGNTDANGATLTGNSHVNGIFSSTTLAAGVLRGGNVQSVGVLVLDSNTRVNAAFLQVGNSTTNTVVNNTSIVFSNSTVSITYSMPTAVQKADAHTILTANQGWASLHSIDERTTTSGTTAQLISSFDAAVYHGGEYLITIDDLGANAKQVSKLLVVSTGNTASDIIDMTEYGIVQTNAHLGTFSANINAGIARIYLTPTPSDASVVVKKSLAII